MWRVAESGENWVDVDEIRDRLALADPPLILNPDKKLAASGH